MFVEFPVCPILYLLNQKIWNDHFAFAAQSFHELCVHGGLLAAPPNQENGAPTPVEG